MKPINSHVPANQLRAGDLWVRPLPEANAAVVHVHEVEKHPDGTVHVTYASKFLYSGEDVYTEAIGEWEMVLILILADTPSDHREDWSDILARS